MVEETGLPGVEDGRVERLGKYWRKKKEIGEDR
jgi:hypothetical protein